MKIPPTQPELPAYEEYAKEIRDIFESGTLTNDGPKLRKFQEMLKDRTGCDNYNTWH